MVRRSSVARPLRLDDLSPRVVQVVRTRLARPGPRQAAPVHPRRAQAGDRQGDLSPPGSLGRDARRLSPLLLSGQPRGIFQPFLDYGGTADTSALNIETRAAALARGLLSAASPRSIRTPRPSRLRPVVGPGGRPVRASCDPFVGSCLGHPILADQATADAGLTGSVETFGRRSTGQGAYLRLRCFRRPVLAGSVGQYLSLSGRRLRHRHIRGH
jgi:hypothetical protein